MSSLKRPRSMRGGEPKAKKARTNTYKVVTYNKTPLGIDHRVLRTTQQATLRYFTGVTLTPPQSGSGFWIFSPSSLRDPDVSGVGTQPRGFDQLMALYDNYMVDEVLIEVMFSSSGSVRPMVVGVALDENSTSKTPKAYGEATVSDMGMIIPGNTTRKIRMTVKPWQFLGLLKGDDTLKGTTAVDPVTKAFFHVFTFCADQGTSPPQVQAQVKLTYKVVLTSPNDPGDS